MLTMEDCQHNKKELNLSSYDLIISANSSHIKVPKYSGARASLGMPYHFWNRISVQNHYYYISKACIKICSIDYTVYTIHVNNVS